MAASPASAGEWLARLLEGDRAALARALTAVESEGPEAASVLRAIEGRVGRAQVIGITGVPGAGKSTLVSALVRELRRREQRVGVVAVDPSSPLSGGAILGDRIRMTEHSGDPGVFVRSLAARGHLGGLSRTTSRVIDVMDAAGFPILLVETVGAGQSEVEIAEIADTKLVVSAPGLGDDVQALKAGLLEIADILVVNKADRPEARRAVAELSAVAAAPVLATSATGGEGIAALADAIERHGRERGTAGHARDPRRRVRRLIANLAAEHARGNLLALEGGELSALYEAVLRGEMTLDAAAERALALLRQPP